jgi:hypothetical protein
MPLTPLFMWNLFRVSLPCQQRSIHSWWTLEHHTSTPFVSLQIANSSLLQRPGGVATMAQSRRHHWWKSWMHSENKTSHGTRNPCRFAHTAMVPNKHAHAKEALPASQRPWSLGAVKKFIVLLGTCCLNLQSIVMLSEVANRQQNFLQQRKRQSWCRRCCDP